MARYHKKNSCETSNFFGLTITINISSFFSYTLVPKELKNRAHLFLTGPGQAGCRHPELNKQNRQTSNEPNASVGNLATRRREVTEY